MRQHAFKQSSEDSNWLVDSLDDDINRGDHKVA